MRKIKKKKSLNKSIIKLLIQNPEKFQELLELLEETRIVCNNILTLREENSFLNYMDVMVEVMTENKKEKEDVKNEYLELNFEEKKEMRYQLTKNMLLEAVKKIKTEFNINLNHSYIIEDNIFSWKDEVNYFFADLVINE